MLASWSILGAVHLLLLAVSALCQENVAGPPGPPGRPHVCIVGGGIGGATAAYYLANSSRITVFEASSRVGGRIQLATLAPGVTAEAGASIIAGRNQLFGELVDVLGLQRVPPGSQYPQKGEGQASRGEMVMGFWDGTAFRLLTSKNGYLSALKMLVRYSLALMRLKPYVSGLLGLFDGLYDGADVGYRTTQALLKRAPGLYDLTQESFQVAVSREFSPWLGGTLFAEEFLSAITRVNYNQDLNLTNSFSGSVAIAGSGDDLWSVAGGNAQVVERLLARLEPDAKVLLASPVARVSLWRGNTGQTMRQYAITVGNESFLDPCDAVIIATPLECSGILVDEELMTGDPWDVGREYQQTITTFVHGKLRRSYFGLGATAELPGMVLTTSRAPAPFSSLARLPHAPGANGSSGWNYFKMFSQEPMSSQDLGRIFENGVRVVERFEWLAYPKFSPPERFAPFDLGGDGNALFYTSPIESAASAIEMSCLSGRNAAALVRDALGIGQGSSFGSEPDSRSNKDEL